jgi:RNA polymerase sigma-70 factor (ECF subfamily)
MEGEITTSSDLERSDLDANGKSPSPGNDEAALARLFSKYELKLSGMVRRLIGHRLAARIDVEDVLQASFVRARTQWIARPPEPESDFCWLYGIVRNQVQDEIRKALGPTRSLEREISLPDDSVAEVVIGLVRSQTTPSGAAIRREEAALLRRAMAELKPRDYEIITMRVFDDLTFPEIGKILDETENTVTQRYHRALHKLLVKLIKPLRDGAEAEES